jgi:hypothetical protein
VPETSHTSAEAGVQAAASVASPGAATVPAGVDVTGARRLDPRLRAAVLLGVQRTRGNRFVQRALLQRQTLKLRNGNEVGAPSGGAPAANIRSEAEQALKRLLDLWAIEVATFDTTVKTTWARYGPADVISGADLDPLKAAIQRAEQRTLANEVANNFLNLSLPAGRGVGDGMANDPADVKAVQTALIAHRYLSAPSATGAIDNATMDAIKLLKLAVAAGTYGQEALRPNEQRDGGDRYAGGTFDATGDTRTWTSPPPPHSRQRVSHTDDKRLAIYVPRTTPAGRNNVHVFFTPDTANPMDFLTTQGLRADEESSGWILIGVPGLDEDAVPNWVTISTAEIETCLRAAGRSSVAIDAIRLSAHSRGARGLEHTLGFRGTPTIDLAKVERVTVFDASYHDLGVALTSHLKDLTAMQDPGHRGRFRAGAVNLYDITVANISGLPGRSLNPSGVRALAYVRFVSEALVKGDLLDSDLTTLRADARKDVQGATRRLLAKLPARGTFSTRRPTPPGFTDLATWLTANAADLALVDDETDGLDDFVTTSRGLDMGFKMGRELTAHHWLVAELSHEAVD